MSDLPRQGLLQQLNAHPHSGEYLEVLGKKAAARWSAGDHKTLTDAVTETVKQAQLSPEQVKRVVEFANTSAYLDEFKKEGGSHHVVDFPGGPADAADILKDLNDGGGGTVFDRGTGDYNAPPSDAKVASTAAERELFEMLDKTAEADLPYASPHTEVIDLKDKLAGASEHLQAQISGFEVMYAELADRVYHQVKQASLSGVSLGEITQAWESVAPSEEYIKVAWSLFTPRLLRDEVFHGVADMVASVDKTASARVVNPAHPLVGEFGEFCETLHKLAELRESRAEINGHLKHLTGYLKTARSLAGDLYGAATRGSEAVAKHVSPLVGKALGPTAGSVSKTLIEQAPNAAIGLGAMEAYTHLKHSPNPVARAARGAGKLVAQNIPGTQANLMHKYEIESGQ